MTQEQLKQIEAWRESIKDRQCDEDIVNAMWLAEEMWERHYSIVKFGNDHLEFDHSIVKFGNEHLHFGTYMMAFCMALMEYIWMPHDIIKSITEDLDDVDTMPEQFSFSTYAKDRFYVQMSYITCNEEGHDYEKKETIELVYTKTEAEALTAILNHANKAGHDAVARLSA